MQFNAMQLKRTTMQINAKQCKPMQTQCRARQGKAIQHHAQHCKATQHSEAKQRNARQRKATQ
eukprot:1435292-Pyramimonas_sp.AAC.1